MTYGINLFQNTSQSYRSEGLPLRDMLSLGAWRMGLGCSGKILPSSSPPSSSPAFFRHILATQSNFWSFPMTNDILGHFVFRRSLFDSILELCRTRRKRLYVLREINQIRLQMKSYFFMEKLGSRSNSWGKRLCVGRESLFFSGFLRKDERKRINVRAFSTLRIGQSCRTRSTFDETVFRQKSVFRNFDVFLCFWDFLGGWFWAFSKRF